MNVIKRSGEEVTFTPEKIDAAVRKANAATNPKKRIDDSTITQIVSRVLQKCNSLHRSVGVEEIQDMVETEIMAEGGYAVAKNYITYRYERALVRKANSTDKQILSLIDRNNEEAKQENSNKNPTVNSTQRDYMAGEVSKDITKRFLLPKEIIEAHEKGIIHFHDADYFAQPMYNCCLVNLEDMLQNGTVITETLIEKPHSFSTACNIATQIIAQVASLFGNLLFVSDDVSTYNSVQKDIFVDVTTQNKAKITYANMDKNGDISVRYTLNDLKRTYCFNVNDGTTKKLI